MEQLERERIREILSNVRRVELRTKRFVDSIFQGAYKSTFKGRGIEFSEVREYQPGDDIRTIDWNVTARFGHPYVKEFIEERDLTILIAFDISGSLDFGTQSNLKKDTATELIASIAFSALRNNDRVGLILFSNRVEKYIPPRKGRKQVMRVIRETLYHEPEEKATDLNQGLEFISRITRKKAIVFFISDFNEPVENYAKSMRILGKKHDLISVNIRDLREEEIPDVGLVSLEDGETGEQILVDTSDEEFRRNFIELANEQRERTTRFHRSNGIDIIDIRTDYDWTKEMIKFFGIRRRRIR
ncbi:MAG: DUF58 domain-containing protein [Candidatus Altiarchaeales archaeon]|nr:DUF58 domain-containing protein [Candidatus Altiarchaeota archaeon]MBU4266766.1 DUF58 domain-containing protein [Candidatus Altiarchaeota archaeon]MBU4341462.1 DUF58 domain-containing protein [Candidatus Altiarchaeota archaeon]MCG2782527.1 DUF58 domain-containing protein [Candidatus Altiarchaeales archaeon]